MTDLEGLWRTKSDAQLADAAEHIEDLHSRSTGRDPSELSMREMNSSTTAQQAAEEAPERIQGPVYFPVSTTKLFLLSVTTFGLYELFWFYKYWSFEKARTKEKISPFWRTFFAPLFAFSLFGRVSELSGTAPFKHLRHFSHSDSVTCAGVFLALAAGVRLPEPWWLVSLFSFVPLLTVQRAVNRINKVHAPEADPNSRFNVANIIVVVLGGILVLMAVAGTFMPT